VPWSWWRPSGQRWRPATSGLRLTTRWSSPATPTAHDARRRWCASSLLAAAFPWTARALPMTAFLPSPTGLPARPPTGSLARAPPPCAPNAAVATAASTSLPARSATTAPPTGSVGDLRLAASMTVAVRRRPVATVTSLLKKSATTVPATPVAAATATALLLAQVRSAATRRLSRVRGLR
jgi:hypothetical protein